jgi:hypothetical protein
LLLLPQALAEEAITVERLDNSSNMNSLQVHNPQTIDEGLAKLMNPSDPETLLKIPCSLQLPSLLLLRALHSHLSL